MNVSTTNIIYHKVLAAAAGDPKTAAIFRVKDESKKNITDATGAALHAGTAPLAGDALLAGAALPLQLRKKTDVGAPQATKSDSPWSPARGPPLTAPARALHAWDVQRIIQNPLTGGRG